MFVIYLFAKFRSLFKSPTTQYVIHDVIKPSARDLISDVITGAVERTLYGQPQRRRPSYSSYYQRTGRTDYYRGARPRTQEETEEKPEAKWTHENKGFHDVLMVAFDISGPDAESTHKWLQQKIDEGVPVGPDGECGTHLDSWWVANDERFHESPDLDSAVFVSVGKQRDARKFLRENGLVE